MSEAAGKGNIPRAPCVAAGLTGAGSCTRARILAQGKHQRQREPAPGAERQAGVKIATFEHGGSVQFGVVTDSGGGAGIIPVEGAMADRFASLGDVLAADALDELKAWATDRTATHDIGRVSLLPPLQGAGKIICIGVNYPKRHPVEGDIPPPENISMFIKVPEALVGHGAALELPRGAAAETFDYEGELVLVIGKAGRYIAPEDCFDHIAGYTIMNDGSVRAWQKHSVTAGKNFAASGACGPWFTSAGEIADPFALKLSTRLNGEEVQSTTASAMIFQIPQLVAYVSSIMPLKPGDIISTGSPEGSGGSRIPQRFLKDGDELEIEWSDANCSLGVLKNRVATA